MRPTTTIRTREPRELLALLPYQLGFLPAESAVVVSLRGPTSRVGLVARVDLADLADADAGIEVARGLVDHLRRDGARRAVAVLYTDGPVGAAGSGGLGGPGAPAARRALDHLRRAAAGALGEVECWVVGSGGYRSADCEDPACCPPQGRPLADLQSTRVGAEMVLLGAGVAASRDELAVIPAAGAADRRAARRAAARWASRAGDAAAPGERLLWRREGLALWRALLERAVAAVSDAEGAPWPGGVPDDGVPRDLDGRAPGPSATELGRLRAALEDVLVRDAVLVGLVPGTGRVADRVLGGDSGEAVGRALRTIVDPLVGEAPDPVLHLAARTVLEDVVAHAPRTGRCPALTLLAVLAWWAGDGARADVLVSRALAQDPTYRLAALLEEALVSGMPPGWVRALGTR